MAKKQRAIAREPKTAYLTKRAIKRAVSKGTRHISEDAVTRKGYVVTTAKGWVVRVDRQGKQTRITKIKTAKPSGKISLD
jgi:hypothetical protein